MKTYSALTLGLGLGICSAASATPTLEELSQIVAAQQDQIEQLQGQASSSSVHIGGYGELHANFVHNGKDSIDFHRFVLFVGHDFSNKLRFRSEIELEHTLSGDGQPGEVELEQAYIEYDARPGTVLRGGLMLVPVGIINETHEPPTFYGVERNQVEGSILPATWWEAGASYSQTLADSGLSYDLMIHSGLSTDLTSSKPIRSGRQKVAKATANDWAATARVRYNGIAGVQLAASLQYQQDMSQVSGDGVDDATLFTTHAIASQGLFSVRALYAQWDIKGNAAEALNRDKIFGWYVEPSVKICPQLGAFVRYSALEQTRDEEEINLVAGLNYWPHDNVVIKADFTRREQDWKSANTETVNLGIGYQF